jgi:hypothetical protein
MQGSQRMFQPRHDAKTSLGGLLMAVRAKLVDENAG